MTKLKESHSEKIGFKEDCLAESIYVYYTEYLETIEMNWCVKVLENCPFNEGLNSL